MHNDIEKKNCIRNKGRMEPVIYSICSYFKSSSKASVSFSAIKYFMTGFYFKDLLPRISVLITVSSCRLCKKHTSLYKYIIFYLLFSKRNVRRWMLHKYVGNMLKESTLLNNEHEHVKIIMHIKIKPWTLKHFSKHHIHLSESFLNREWSCKQIQIGFSPFHVAQKHISILSLYSNSFATSQ